MRYMSQKGPFLRLPSRWTPILASDSIWRRMALAYAIVAWSVDNLRQVAHDRGAKGTRLRDEGGIMHSPRGYIAT
jgi:hypothetical protein